MKIPFQKTLPPIYFYGLMVIFFALSQYFISQSYQSAYPDYHLSNILKTEAEVAGAEEMNCDCEMKFQKSYPVVWIGHVVATFAGGEDIGVETYDQTDKYHRFYVDGNGLYNYDLGEEVRVEGKLIGLTCAYANTVSGKCVGEVAAEKITAIKAY
ncbi:MAG: hypothetical protein PHR36_04130 [Patescibacteria group bacterium]|nr:hypothetical protein [Patescibacteria group bacterium]